MTQKFVLLPIFIIFSFLLFCFGPFDPNNPLQGESGDSTATNNPLPVSDTTFLAYWDFDDSGSNVLGDKSKYISHGVINGGGKWVQGIKGSALSFDGNDDYVSVSLSEQFNFKLSNFTVSLFVKLQSENSSDTNPYDIISKGEKCASGFNVFVKGNAVKGQIKNVGCDDKDSTSIKDGKWHHIVLLRRDGKGYLYFDKSRKQSISCNDTVYSVSPLRIGANSVKNEGYFPGSIDEIKISKTAWSESQINAEYDRCF
ncbi:MAG TPA: LamG domain-containing protein [Chitinispirillaceae bacterium]|nr:LamG domain-containing protein [Chitinispirillaceae bacterium]